MKVIIFWDSIENAWQVQGKKVKKENRLRGKNINMAGNVGMHEDNKPDFLH